METFLECSKTLFVLRNGSTLRGGISKFRIEFDAKIKTSVRKLLLRKEFKLQRIPNKIIKNVGDISRQFCHPRKHLDH